MPNDKEMVKEKRLKVKKESNSQINVKGKKFSRTYASLPKILCKNSNSNLDGRSED